MPAVNRVHPCQASGIAPRRFSEFFYLTENNQIVICQVPKQKKTKNKVEKILLFPLAYFPFGYNVSGIFPSGNGADC